MSKRSDEGAVTLFCFLLGVGLLVFRDGIIACAVLLIGFAIVGEMQRKANDVIDALKGRRDD